MDLFSNKKLIEELEWLAKCLDEDKIQYKASINFDSTHKHPYVTINNKHITLTITCKEDGLTYVIRDEDIVRWAYKEGYTKEQIETDIKCNHIVDASLAEIIITKPHFLGECRLDLIKDNLEKEKNNP